METDIATTTRRLAIQPMAVTDNQFIYELVNSAGWLTFIGNRNVHSDADAVAYIDNILEKPNTIYWVVRLRGTGAPLGVITFIQRDYLPYRDIGFAFLPQHVGRGYAYEATRAMMDMLARVFSLHTLLATTLPHNTPSIKLLTKLNFGFESEIMVDETVLHVYRYTVEDTTPPRW